MRIEKQKTVIILKSKEGRNLIEIDFNKEEECSRAYIYSRFLSGKELKELSKKIQELIIIYESEK